MHYQGTYDEEGSPFVVFTGSRHDQKHSDTKATMQLLFYTLDQMSERCVCVCVSVCVCVCVHACVRVCVHIQPGE